MIRAGWIVPCVLAATVASGAAQTVRESVDFGVPSGIHTNEFQLTLMAASGAVIRVTYDGTVPDICDGDAYQGPVRIARTSVVTARSFREGVEPGPPVSRTYIFPDRVVAQPALNSNWPAGWGGALSAQVVEDPEYGPKIAGALRALPSVSVVVDPRDLLDGAHGLLANACEDGREWERPVSVEWFSPTGLSFRVRCGLRVYGGTSRTKPKKSFRLLFKRQYGPSKLRAAVFSDPEAVTSFDTLILRGGNNDSFLVSGLADEFVRRTQLAMGWPSAHGTFAHFYINGSYSGLYNVVERPDAAFATAYLGGPKDAWDVLNAGKPVNESTLAAWNGFLEILASGGDQSRSNILDGQFLDVDGFIDYMLIHMWAQTRDWPEHNWYAAQRRENPIGWRFFVWDAEQSLFEPREDVVSTGGPAGVFGMLRNDPNFVARFAERARRHCTGDGALTPTACSARWGTLMQEVEPAIVAEIARWGRLEYARMWPVRQAHIQENYMRHRTEEFLEQLSREGLLPEVN